MCEIVVESPIKYVLNVRFQMGVADVDVGAESVVSKIRRLSSFTIMFLTHKFILCCLGSKSERLK